MVTATSSQRFLEGFDSTVGVAASRARAHPSGPKRIGFEDGLDSRQGAAISGISDIAMSSTRTPSFMSPLPNSGYSDLHSTLDAGSRIEAEMSSLKRTLEDTCAQVRELKRQHSQDTHLRSERDDSLESLKAKLTGCVTREQLDAQIQELRTSSERRHADTSRDFQKRIDLMEASVESLQTVVEASTSAAELGSIIGKADTSQSMLDSKLDIRLTSLEHKTTKLSAQLAGLDSNSSRHESEATIAAEGASKRAENAERRADAVEASYDTLFKKLNKLSMDLHVLCDTTTNDRERTSHLQHGIEELRERISSSHNTLTTNLVSVETTTEQQRLKLDEEVRARQSVIRDLEQQIAGVTSNLERVTAGSRTSAASDAMIDIEARMERLRQHSAGQFQQIQTRLQKSEDALKSVETVTSGNATAMLARLAKLEVLVSEDVSKFERLEQRFEERTSEFKSCIDIAVDQRSSEAIAKLCTKLESERSDVVERKWEQVQSEVRSLSMSIDMVKDSQRSSLQLSNVDAGRLTEVRQEAKRCTEEMGTKLRMWIEDLDARFREFEPAIRDHSSDISNRMRNLEKQVDKWEPRISSTETTLKDMKEIEFRFRELEPRMRQMQTHLESNSGFKEKDLEPRVRELEQTCTKSVEKLESRCRELEPLVKQMDFRFKELEIRLVDLKDFEPRLRGFEPSLLRLEAQVKDVDGKLKDMEPRQREFEPRMKELLKEVELRVKDLEKEHVRDLEPRLRDCERELLPRIKDIEPRLTRLHEFEPRLTSIESRLREIEPNLRDVGARFMRPHELESRLRDIEKDVKDIEPRIKEFEPRLRELEPRVKELHLWSSGFEPRLKQLEPNMSSLEQTLKGVEPRLMHLEHFEQRFKILEPHVSSFEQTVKGIEPRVQQLENHRLEMDRVASAASETSDSVASLQRTFETRIGECFSSVREESAAWRDALRAESAAWREACGDLRCRTESTREEVQHLALDAREIANRCREIANHNVAEWKAEVSSEKVKLDQLSQGLNEIKHRMKEKVDEANAKLEAKIESRITQSLNEVGWRLSHRIDESDACNGETRAAIDDHQRQLSAIEQALQVVRKRVEQEKDEFNQFFQSSRQEITTHAVSEAIHATKEKLEEATKATDRCEEISRQASRISAEVDDLGKDLARKFERWSDQAQEVAQLRTQERLQEMVRLSLGDLTNQLTSISEKHCDKVIKKSQKEIQADTREDLLKLAAETTSKCEQSLTVLSSRFESEVSRLDGQSNQLQSQIAQEAGLREAVEQGLTSLVRGFDHQRANLADVCDRVLPGLQGALAEEKQSRSEEAQRFQDRFREIEGRGEEQIAAQRRSEVGLHDKFVESLRGAEAAVLAVDKRLFCLEEATEERLQEIAQEVNHDYGVVKRVVAQVEGNQRGDLQVLEGKMDRIARAMHTPSSTNTDMGISRSKSPSLGVEDREAFRRRFRASLGDSLYVKKALNNGGRGASSEICLHNERLSRRNGR